MSDDAHDGPAAIPAGVDTLSLVAEGFFPTHAPRPTGGTPLPAVLSAIDRACSATAAWDSAALLAQPPLERELATIRTPSHSAAGLAAIANSFRVALPRLGARDTLRTFLTVNQKTGFDCQSCAWPSPDGKRHRFEFCESGAKAMANEGSRHRITAGFFRTWSIDTLAAQPDWWLNAQGRLTEPMLRREGCAHYEPVGWAEAFDLIGRELRALPSPNGAAISVSCSPRTSRFRMCPRMAAKRRSTSRITSPSQALRRFAR